MISKVASGLRIQFSEMKTVAGGVSLEEKLTHGAWDMFS